MADSQQVEREAMEYDDDVVFHCFALDLLAVRHDAPLLSLFCLNCPGDRLEAAIDCAIILKESGAQQ